MTSGKIICVVNRKGGVGKTTLALALADALADQSSQTKKGQKQERLNVLALDLDPQASLTAALFFNDDAAAQHAELEKLSKGKRTFAHWVEAIAEGKVQDAPLQNSRGPPSASYTLCANDAAAWDIELKLEALALKKAVKEGLKRLSAKYDFIIIDCPPGQTAFAESAILNADLILCPMTPDYLAYWGTESFDHYLKGIFARHKKENHPKAFWVFTNYHGRAAKNGAHHTVIQLMEARNRNDPFIRLLKESGKSGPGDKITIPYDRKIAERLEAPRNVRKSWMWSSSYKEVTREAFARLRTAVLRETENG